MSVFKAPSLWPGFFSYPTGTRNYRLKKGWYMSSSQSSYVTKFLDKPHEYLTGLPRSPALYSPMLLFYVLREALLERHLLFNALSSSKTTQKNNDWVREHACQGERRNRTYLKKYVCWKHKTPRAGSSIRDRKKMRFLFVLCFDIGNPGAIVVSIWVFNWLFGRKIWEKGGNVDKMHRLSVWVLFQMSAQCYYKSFKMIINLSLICH